MKIIYLFIVITLAAAFGAIAATPPLVTYTDKSQFLLDTGATSATGPLPLLGIVSSAKVGTITISSTSGSSDPSVALAFGILGKPNPADFLTPLLPGYDLGVGGFEDLNITLDTPAFSFGFDFAEHMTIPSEEGSLCGRASCVDSTFTVTLLLGSSPVGSFTFNAPNDVASFVGVKSTEAFNRVEIRETQGGVENDYFGQFYTEGCPLGVKPDASPSPCILKPSDGASPQSGFVAISGVGQPGHTLDVLVNDSSVGSVEVDYEGNWEALAYLSTFGGAPFIQVEDQTTFDTSNTITVFPLGFVFESPALTPPTRLLPLRHADILVTSGVNSQQSALYGPNYTHTALYLGGDSEGTPLIAEAVPQNEAGTFGEVRTVTLEQSTVWTKSIRISAFRPQLDLPGATRNAIVGWAKTITAQGLPYWNVATNLLGPVLGSYALYVKSFGIRTPRIDLIFAFMNANKNSTTKFICSTLVWRAYFEGSGHSLDISNPNLISATPKSFLGKLPVLLRDPFIDELRPVLVLPETFVRTPKLRQIL